VSWKLRKSDVGLRVTRFLPEVAPAQPAGLTDKQRAALRQRRERECAKVEPAIDYPDWRIEELARKYGGSDSDGR
jgi:hypothetical protein